MTDKFDLFIFGSTSEIIQALFERHRPWFIDHVQQLFLVQRGPDAPAVYAPLDPVTIQLDCSDPGRFKAGLQQLVTRHAASPGPKHVFPTYGRFSWNYAARAPVFSFTDDGLQVNLNARLQILDAFRSAGGPVRHHLLGSLFANFPYTGDYALSMWYINQVPRNPEYAAMDIGVYNIGGCRTRFWDHQRGGDNPFMHRELPLDALFKAAFLDRRRGVTTIYPTVTSRVACFLGRRGLRLL